MDFVGRDEFEAVKAMAAAARDEADALRARLDALEAKRAVDNPPWTKRRCAAPARPRDATLKPKADRHSRAYPQLFAPPRACRRGLRVRHCCSAIGGGGTA